MSINVLELLGITDILDFVKSMFKSRIVLYSFLTVIVVGAWLAAWAFWFEPGSIVVRNYEINIAEWNPKLDNFKIVLISDVHGGSNFVDEARIREVVTLANAQNADLIVLLGDYVSQKSNHIDLKMPMATIADNLRGLNAKHGVFAILGNHDNWYDEKIPRAEFERVGYKVLENEAVVVTRNDANLVILGLPDALKIRAWQKYSDNAKAALSKINASGDILVLSHNPDIFPIINSSNPISDDFRLLLAGHTHGGQVNFPYFGALVVPSDYGQKYARGHVVENGKHLFVTSGIGMSVFPVRFRVPPEISVVNVRAAD